MLDCHSHDIAATGALIAVTPQQAIDGVSVPATSRLAVGLHPWQLHDTNIDALALLRRAAALPGVVAIGECGLDRLRGPRLETQCEVLTEHILLAECLGKPLVMHCVRAANELAALWRRTAPHSVAAVVHGFRGNANVARMLLDAGFFLSYGTRFNADALLATPLDRLLAETDDAPVAIRTVVDTLAATLDTSPAALTATLERNLAAILN